MRRFAIFLAAFLATATLLCAATTTKPATKLSKDEQILHVLNRLTFGPRPGEVAEMRRTGIEKWIDLQLHPERIAENPVLEERLKPFETLRLTSAEVLKAYPQIPPGMMIQFTPLNDLRRQLVYCENGSSVRMTMVAGEIVYENGQVRGIDEPALRAEAREQSVRMQQDNRAVREQAEQWLPFYRQMYLKAARREIGMQRWAGDPRAS